MHSSTIRRGSPPARRRTPVVAGTRRPRPAPKPAEPPPSTSDTESPRSNRSPLVLVVVALLLAAAGGWFTVTAPAEVTNLAVVDAGATAEVSGQVRDGLERIFSYRFDDAEPTERAAHDVLTGAAPDQYAALFTDVVSHAAEQRLVLRSTVAVAGVSLLDGDRAALLVFLDQSATRGDTGAINSGGAQLSVTAKRIDGHWRIAGLRPR